MKITMVRISNFQSFGPAPTTVELDSITYLLGPNGAGKTSLLAALARMFAVDTHLRKVQSSDFHVPYGELADSSVDVRMLWVEAEFEFDELADGSPALGVPPFFSHVRLVSASAGPRVRIRLTATIDDIGDIEDKLCFVLTADQDGEPTETKEVDRFERSAIQVHYLPARRDPAQHIAYAGTALLGRLLRSINWDNEQQDVADLLARAGQLLGAHPAVSAYNIALLSAWQSLHSGAYFSTPIADFISSDITAILRRLNIAFDPAPGGGSLEWSRLSDGQQSLLYLAIVLASHDLGRKVLSGAIHTDFIDRAKLRPASFTMIAIEEPENSLSPHYLGRVVERLSSFATGSDAQAIIATQSPSVVRRVVPEVIRHLRLDASRQTVVSRIQLPPTSDVAYKFVREAVQAYPELYFARLVVLGEGDSEQIVLPRMLEASGLRVDLNSLSIVPLGGRHVNHFWRLLSGLRIPFVTLLDLDVARYQAGWGRVRYALQQLLEHPTDVVTKSSLSQAHVDGAPTWNDATDPVLTSTRGEQYRKFLELCRVYFSEPLDLDFVMLTAFPAAYEVDTAQLKEPTAETLTAVLGKARANESQYSDEQKLLFSEYHRKFINGSKPVHHLSAMSRLDDKELLEMMPAPIARMIEGIRAILNGLPE